jgi:hypothetical protein
MKSWNGSSGNVRRCARQSRPTRGRSRNVRRARRPAVGLGGAHRHKANRKRHKFGIRKILRRFYAPQERHSDERHLPLRRNRGPRISHNDRSGVRGLCFEWKTLTGRHPHRFARLRVRPVGREAREALICRPSRGMPRDGAIIFADLIGKLDLLWVACEKCGAVSQIFQYDATMLHNRRGPWKLAVHTLRPDRRRRIGQCRVRSNIS